MAVTIVNGTLNANATSTGASSNTIVSQAITSDFAVGDLVIADFTQERTTTPVPPAAWTQLFNSGTTSTVLVADLRYRFIQSIDELDDIVSYATDGTTKRMALALHGFRGAGIPSIVSNAHVQNGASTLTLIHPGVASAAVGGMLMSVANARSSSVPWEGRTFTPAAGWTKAVEIGTTSTTAVNPYVFAATKPVTVAGAQAGVTHSVNNADTSYFGSMVYIPAGSAPASLTATPNAAVVPGSNIVLNYTGTGTLTQTAGPTAGVVSTSAGTTTVQAPYTNAGTTLTFSYGGATVNVAVLKATLRLVVTGGPNPVEVPLKHVLLNTEDILTPGPTGPTGPTLTPIDIDVQEARRYYPGGDLATELGHLKPVVRTSSFGILEIIPYSQGGLPLVAWVPSNSTLTAGTRYQYVYKGRIFNPATNTALDTYLNSVDGQVIIECPEQFTAANATNGLELSNVYSAVVLGADVNMNAWKGSTTPTTVYRTPADMAAGTNGVPMPTGGTWHYPTTAADLDPNNAHRQTIYAQGWTETARQRTGRGFQAWEGTYIHGEFAYEHFDWNGRNTAAASNFRLVLAGTYMERVGVLMHPDSSNKSPGGDGIQIFGGCKEYVQIGSTVNSTGYQAGFYQNDQGMGGAGSAGYPSLFVVKRSNARWESDTARWGGATSETGPQQFAGTTFANNGTSVVIEDVFVWRPNRSRSQLIGGNWTDVQVADHANFVDVTKVGIAYNPVGFS